MRKYTLDDVLKADTFRLTERGLFDEDTTLNTRYDIEEDDHGRYFYDDTDFIMDIVTDDVIAKPFEAAIEGDYITFYDFEGNDVRQSDALRLDELKRQRAAIDKQIAALEAGGK